MPATMKTPARFLEYKGMPKTLPFKGFSDELNKGLMAKNETETAAAAMNILLYRAELSLQPMDLFGIKEKAWNDFDDRHPEDEDGDLDFPSNERYAVMADMVIMKHLEMELASPKVQVPVQPKAKTVVKSVAKSKAKAAVKKAMKAKK